MNNLSGDILTKSVFIEFVLNRLRIYFSTGEGGALINGGSSPSVTWSHCGINQSIEDSTEGRNKGKLVFLPLRLWQEVEGSLTSKPSTVRWDFYHQPHTKAIDTGEQHVARPWGTDSGVRPRSCGVNPGFTTWELFVPGQDTQCSKLLSFSLLFYKMRITIHVFQSYWEGAWLGAWTACNKYSKGMLGKTVTELVL